MSALDLFAMLNAPLPGNGAGASASDPSGVDPDGAFAGLLAMMAPKGDGRGEAAAAATTASVGMSLAPFRFSGSTSNAAADGAAADGTGGEDADADEAGPDAPAVARAGLMVPTPTPAPSPTPTTPGLPVNPSAPAVEAAPPPADATPRADSPQPAPPAPSSDDRPVAADDRPAAAGGAETGAAFQSPAPQGAQAAQAAQVKPTAPGASPPLPGTVPVPPAAAPTPETVADAIRTAAPPATADARLAAESARAAGQQAAATALSPEAGRLAQPPRPEQARTDRRGERRDGESRSALFAPTDTGEAARSTVAAPAQASAAVAAPSPPRPGTPPEIRAEPAPVVADPATPDGEAAPEPVRTTESQSAGSLREHLPSTLSRAGVETTAMLSAQIVRRLEARSTRFDMVLTPEDLGRVDVRMEVDADGQLTARLAFDNPAAAAELRGRADELRRQLEAAGFQLSDSSLEFAGRDGGRRDQPFDQRGRAFAGAGRLADTADAISTPPRWTALSLTPEGVDVKV